MGQLSSYCQHLALEKQQKVTVAGQKALTPSDNRSTTQPDSQYPQSHINSSLNSDRSSNNPFLKGLKDTSGISLDSSASSSRSGLHNDDRYSAILQKSSRIGTDHYPLWQLQLQTNNPHSQGFYILPTDTHLSLVLPCDPDLACCFISILAYHQRFSTMLITPERYIRCTQSLYESKVFLNGGWRCVQVSGCRSTWASLSERVVEGVWGQGRGLAMEEVAYRLLGWLPEQVEMGEVGDKVVLFHWMREQWDQGKVMVGITLNHRVKMSVIGFQAVQMSKYVVVRLGKDYNGIQQFMPAIVPQQLQNLVNKSKNIFVLDWPSLQRQHAVFNISWLPAAFSFQKLLHDQYRADKYPPQINNFAQQKYSLYCCPQYMLRVDPHQGQLQIRIFVDRHIADIDIQQKVNILLYPYTGTRKVYVQPPIPPTTYTCYPSTLSCSYLLPSNPTSITQYCLVITRQAIKDISFTYSLAVICNVEVGVYRLGIPPLSRSMRLQAGLSASCDSIYSPSLLEAAMWTVMVTTKTNLEVRTECRDKAVEIMNVVYRMGEGEKAPLVLTTGFVRFAEKAVTAGFFYPGLSYSNIEVTPGTYLLIPLTKTAPKQPTKLAVSVRCTNNSAVTLTQVPQYPRFPIKKSRTGTWLQKTKLTIPTDFQTLPIPKQIYQGKHGCLFSIPCPQLSFQCWLRPTQPLTRIPSLTLLVVGLSKRSQRIAAKRLFYSDFVKTTAGVRTGKLTLAREVCEYCCVVCLGEEGVGYRLEVTLGEEVDVKALTQELRL